MKSPFVVNIATIHGQPGSRQQESVHGPLDELFVSGSRVPEGAEVSFEGALEAMEASQSITAVGTVAAPWEGECRRCLGPASGVIREDVREIFETDPVEGETYALKNDVCDLEPMVRETVMLELPEAPVCRADCRGFCDTCGANLNDDPDHHHEAPTDPRWGALDALKNDL